MRISRTLLLLTALAGTAIWAIQRYNRLRHQQRRRFERIEKSRWEGEGGATSIGPQISESVPPSAGAAVTPSV